jgi:hypothetical protein
MTDHNEIVNRQYKRRLAWWIDITVKCLFIPSFGLSLLVITSTSPPTLYYLSSLLAICTLTSSLLLYYLYELLYFNLTFRRQDALRRRPSQSLSFIVLLRATQITAHVLFSTSINTLAASQVSLGLAMQLSNTYNTFCDQTVSLTYGGYLIAFTWANAIVLISALLNLNLLTNNLVLVITLGMIFTVSIHSNL